MNDSGIMIGAVALMTSLIIALVFILVGLLQRLTQLEHRCGVLESQLRRGSDDVAGLCSSALVVDRRLASQEVRLQELQNTVSHMPSHATPHVEIEEETDLEEPVLEGYDKAIHLIHRGADVATLVKSCNVTRDEAMLLMRLHGSR